MNQKILLCRISWKEDYKLEKEAENGGQFVKDHGNGGERHNFLAHRGHYYGYVQPSGKSESVNMNISKLGAGQQDDHIDNITVIWVATKPKIGGRWVVGVYKNATVYRESQSIKGDKRRESDVYRAKATECGSFVVHKDTRNIRIPDDILRGRASVYYDYDLNHKKYPTFSTDIKLLLDKGVEHCENNRRKYGTGGESEEHKKLKGYAQEHPELFEVSPNAKSNVEYPLPSGDFLDVLFKDGDKWTAVEVKSCRSDDNDLKRGIYQCVKYHAVLEAMKKAEKCPQNLEVFLLSEKPLPKSLKPLHEELEIKIKLPKRTWQH